MIKEGLIKESKRLAKKYSWNLPSMSGIGYKQMYGYFNKQTSLEETIEIIKKILVNMRNDK